MPERLPPRNLKRKVKKLIPPAVVVGLTALALQSQPTPPSETPTQEPTPVIPVVPSQDLPNSIIGALQPSEPESDAIIPPPPSAVSISALPPDAPDSRVAFLLGNVNVDTYFPSSLGNQENWTPEEIAIIEQKLKAGFGLWAGFGKGLLTFHHRTNIVPVTDEPISLRRDEKEKWIRQIQAKYGYNDPDIYVNADRQIMDWKAQNGSDFGIIVFVIDASNDPDGKSTDGKTSYANIGGPFIVIHWNEGKVGPFDAIASHEAGHGGGAGDQYAGAQSKCTDVYGYNNTENQNSRFGQCRSKVESIMESLNAFLNNAIDQYALAQVGLSDTPGGLPFDVLGHPRFVGEITADAKTIKVNGAAEIKAHPAAPGKRTVNINKIIGVELVTSDGGIYKLKAEDGEFNSAYERVTANLPRALGIREAELRFTVKYGGKIVVVRRIFGSSSNEYTVYMPLLQNNKQANPVPPAYPAPQLNKPEAERKNRNANVLPRSRYKRG